MSDQDPGLLRRLLHLRRFPLFGGAELGPLAVLAENVAESWYPAGAVIAPPGRVEAIHLVLSGGIETGPARVGAREAFGWLDVLARRPLAAPAVAAGETRTLRLAASDLGELLEDNFGLLAVALRELAGRTLASRARSGPPHRPTPAAPPLPGPLGLVERMIVLRQRRPFTSARLDALAILAYESQETAWPAGHVVSRQGEPVRAAYFILDGELRVAPAGAAPAALGPGGMVGVLETLAGERHGATITAVTAVRALEVSSTAIFDVLEDHADLGLAMLETFAGELLDAAEPAAPPAPAASRLFIH